MIKELKITRSITQRTPILTSYMNDISRYPLLTIDEEVELATSAQAGDEDAKQKLVEANLRFVISVAKQFVSPGIALEDLIMEGNIGLINAVERFDPTRGFKFSTFAVWWIRQGIQNALADKVRNVRLPLNQVGLLMRVRKAEQTFIQHNERPPMPEEIAEILDLPVEKVKEAMSNAAIELSIDAPMSNDGDTTIADTLISPVVATDSHLMHESLCAEIRIWLERLHDERAKEIIIYSFGLNGTMPLSLDDLAIKYDLSRERIRQIQQQSLRRMRANHISS